MSYVINEPCIGVKDASCTEVCPVDCIHPTPDEPGFAEAEQLYIDPEECIDCDACVEACPVDAITSEDQVPPEWQHYIAKNAAYYQEKQRMTSTTPSKRAPGPADDSGGGLAMFVVFTAAVLIVTGAVALLALAEGWWMLGLAFAVHVGMTAVVVLTIIHVIDGRARAIADRDRPSPSPDRRFEGRARTGTDAVTVP